MAAQLSHGGFASELGLRQRDLSMQGKEKPVPEIAAVLQQPPLSPSPPGRHHLPVNYRKGSVEQFLMCPRWAAGRGTATTRVPGWV